MIWLMLSSANFRSSIAKYEDDVYAMLSSGNEGCNRSLPRALFDAGASCRRWGNVCSCQLEVTLNGAFGDIKPMRTAGASPVVVKAKEDGPLGMAGMPLKDLNQPIGAVLLVDVDTPTGFDLMRLERTIGSFLVPVIVLNSADVAVHHKDTAGYGPRNAIGISHADHLANMGGIIVDSFFVSQYGTDTPSSSAHHYGSYRRDQKKHDDSEHNIATFAWAITSATGRPICGPKENEQRTKQAEQ